MKWILPVLLIIPGAFAHADEVEDGPSGLEIFYDFEVYRLLPRKWEFENPQDKLFRSNDGRTIYWGPSEEKTYFIIQPTNQVRRLEAPSVGKAYVDKVGEFVLWYDSIDQGINYKDREPLIIKSPLRSRFGVSYDLNFSYLYEKGKAEVYRALSYDPIIQLEGIFTYKVVGAGDQLWVFGFSYLGHEATRQHLVLRFQQIDSTWMEMERFNLPDNLTLMDVDPFAKKALFLNEAEIAPQAFEVNLQTQRIHGLGLVEEFAIYLHPDFRKKADAPSKEVNAKEKMPKIE